MFVEVFVHSPGQCSQRPSFTNEAWKERVLKTSIFLFGQNKKKQINCGGGGGGIYFLNKLIVVTIVACNLQK
jgi:hypothetical protein